jgi:hypothetical protein
MCVSIDPSRDKKFITAIDDFSILIRNTAGNLGDLSILYQDISLLRKISIDDSGIF